MTYFNSDIGHVIDEVIHNKTVRDMLKDKLIDGLTYNELAAKYGYSLRQAQRIIYKNQEVVFKHIKP